MSKAWQSPAQMQVRAGTCDTDCVKEQACYAGLLDCIKTGDVVLDIGGNIGAFAERASRVDCTVFSYEPEPTHCSMYLENTKHAFGKVVLTHAAVVSSTQETVSLWLNEGKNKGLHSTTFFKGRTEITVPAIHVKELEQHNPQHVKIDCEGSEYDLLPHVLKWKGVQSIAVELHLTKKGWREKGAEALRQLRQAFPRHVKKGMVGERNFWTLFVGCLT